MESVTNSKPVITRSDYGRTYAGGHAVRGPRMYSFANSSPQNIEVLVFVVELQLLSRKKAGLKVPLDTQQFPFSPWAQRMLNIPYRNVW